MNRIEGEEKLEMMGLEGSDMGRPRSLEVDSFRKQFGGRARGAVDGMDLEGLS